MKRTGILEVSTRRRARAEAFTPVESERARVALRRSGAGRRGSHANQRRIRTRTADHLVRVLSAQDRGGLRVAVPRDRRAEGAAPAFVSVTWGAGGSTRRKTVELTARIQDEIGITAMSHLTCVGSTADELRATLRAAARSSASRTCSRWAATSPTAYALPPGALDVRERAGRARRARASTSAWAPPATPRRTRARRAPSPIWRCWCRRCARASTS